MTTGSEMNALMLADNFLFINLLGSKNNSENNSAEVPPIGNFYWFFLRAWLTWEWLRMTSISSSEWLYSELGGSKCWAESEFYLYDNWLDKYKKIFGPFILKSTAYVSRSPTLPLLLDLVILWWSNSSLCLGCVKLRIFDLNAMYFILKHVS